MLQSVSVNFAAVIAATVAQFMITLLWHGVFFKSIEARHKVHTTKKLSEDGKGITFAIAIVCTIIMNYVLGLIIGFSEASTIQDAVLVAFAVWVGFIAPLKIAQTMMDHKPKALLLINASCILLSLVISAMILTLW